MFDLKNVTTLLGLHAPNEPNMFSQSKFNLRFFNVEEQVNYWKERH